MLRTPTAAMRGLRSLLGKPPQRTIWLRPNGRNLDDMLYIVDQAIRQRRDYVQFMLHSSEFMPGGSPTFDSPESIERLYGHLERLFEHASRNFVGSTLSEYAQAYRG